MMAPDEPRKTILLRCLEEDMGFNRILPYFNRCSFNCNCGQLCLTLGILW